MRLRLRFHHLLTAILALFLLALTAAFLYLGYGRLVRMAEQNAGTIFAQIAARNAARLESMLDGAADIVRLHASLGLAGHHQMNEPGSATGEALLATFIDTLDRHDAIYSLYFGLDNDDFVQVIGIRDDDRLRTNLAAPAHSRFAIRRIKHKPGGERSESWHFIAADASVLGMRIEPASYQPRQRPWFQLARDQHQLQLTDPYLFASTEQIGITLAQTFRDGGGVFALDLRLDDLGNFIAADLHEHEGGAVVLDGRGRVLAFEFTAGLSHAVPTTPLQWPDDSDDPYLQALLSSKRSASEAAHIARVLDTSFVYAERSVALGPERSARIAAFSPIRSFSAPIIELGEDLGLIAAGLLALALPLGFVVTRSASAAVTELAADAERIKRFDFSGEPRLGLVTHEFQALGSAQRLMKASLRIRTAELKDALGKLHILVEHGLLLAGERDPARLPARIEAAACQLTGASRAHLYLKGADGRLCTHDGRHLELDGALPSRSAAAQCAQAIASNAVTRASSVDDGGQPHHGLAAALRTSRGELIGVLQVLEPSTSLLAADFPESVTEYVESFAAQAALAFENHQLLAAQNELIDAMVRILAAAIDAKSPYTGAHCARVPELAVMLAEAACASPDRHLAPFDGDNAEQWREFRIGAWLHDCGKVTTPSAVMDKATKLETLYNRLHEIRTRFEVLLRDARIEALEAQLQGDDPAAADAVYQRRARQLEDDFAFIAHCNQGSEAMDPAALGRLEEIAGQRWWRHFDDRLGLSHAELAQRTDCPPAPLPAAETLLADQPWHRLPRPANQRFGPEQGFDMAVPELLYNFGERYNLSILHGTLSTEERFKINEHVIQTLLMLEALPLPANLRRVPEYAGTHHETLDGSGYPRRLQGEQLSIPARIMAIADIFEALTAADRPYKAAKPLSEAVAILAGHVRAGHIDGDLFALFLRSGVHLAYARRFLRPEQIDAVDVEAVLAELTLAPGA